MKFILIIAVLTGFSIANANTADLTLSTQTTIESSVQTDVKYTSSDINLPYCDIRRTIQPGHDSLYRYEIYTEVGEEYPVAVTKGDDLTEVTVILEDLAKIGLCM